MPEVRFHIRWPDGSREACYSPSTVIRDHFTPGAAYSLVDFLARARTGLHAASERVRTRFGSPCSLALGQLARFEARSQDFADQPDATVLFETFLEQS